MTDSNSSEILALGQSILQNLTLPLGGIPVVPAWPNKLVATPLIEGVKVETSTNPHSVMIVIDLLTLIQGGKSAARACKTAAPVSGTLAQCVAKEGTKAAAKAAIGKAHSAAAGSLPWKAATPGTFDSLLGGLQGFFQAFPVFGLLLPSLDFMVENRRSR